MDRRAVALLLSVLSFGMSAVAMWIALRGPEQVSVSRLKIADTRNPRRRVEFTPNGICLFNNSGKSVLEVKVSNDRPGIILRRDSFEPVALLAEGEGGAACFGMFTQDNQTAIDLRANSDSGGQIAVYTPDGERAVNILVMEKHHGAIATFSAHGRTVAHLHSQGLGISRADGAPLAVLTRDERMVPYCAFYGHDERELLRFEASREFGSELWMTSGKGNGLFSVSAREAGASLKVVDVFGFETVVGQGATR